jgi:hypothetical protein
MVTANAQHTPKRFEVRLLSRSIVATVALMSLASAGWPQPVDARPTGNSSLARHLASSRSVLLGVSVDRIEQAGRFETRARKRPGLVNIYSSFASPSFDVRRVEAIRTRGALSMMTWLPCHDGSLGALQPDFSLRRIIAGDFDEYVRAWASEAAAWGHPVLLRFAPEMNGSWNPWSAGVNGNTARDFRRAWRHVHHLFAAAGAQNVEWVWSPNVVMPGAPALSSLYPGDRYVDWVGIDGYNWGKSQPWSHWQDFDQVFGRTLKAVRALTKRPLMLTEVASAERGGDKGSWIREFFQSLRVNRDILAFVWFNYRKEADWRIDSSPRSRTAFAAGAAQPRVRGSAAIARWSDS